MSMPTPHSPAAERNRLPILRVLRRQIEPGWRVLEIGAGTGQHACYFAEQLADVTWQATDTAENVPILTAGLFDSPGGALLPPIVLDVLRDDWPAGPWDAVYSANTAHIMHWRAVCAMLEGAAAALRSGGVLVLYGPFSRDGAHTSESNRRFDDQLRGRDPAMGIRDLSAVESAAVRNGFCRIAEYAMPANNLLLVWRLKRVA
ncbi:MAG: DUF938 domain-containing protein [Gammaproteobacteria bacterium]